MNFIGGAEVRAACGMGVAMAGEGLAMARARGRMGKRRRGRTEDDDRNHPTELFICKFPWMCSFASVAIVVFPPPPTPGCGFDSSRRHSSSFN